MGIQLPLGKTMVAVTFIDGLLPVIGNLISNSVIVVVSLSVSPLLAAGSLGFLEDLGVSVITLSCTKTTEAYEQGPDASFALLLVSPDEIAALRPAIVQPETVRSPIEAAR